MSPYKEMRKKVTDEWLEAKAHAAFVELAKGKPLEARQLARRLDVSLGSLGQVICRLRKTKGVRRDKGSGMTYYALDGGQ